MANSTECTSGRDRKCASAHFGTSLARYVASWQATTNVLVSATACVAAPISAHPSHASWPHMGAPPKALVAVTTCVTAPTLAHPSHA
eukprot:9259815-Pyramimonas_sp.AAC.1